MSPFLYQKITKVNISLSPSGGRNTNLSPLSVLRGVRDDVTCVYDDVTPRKTDKGDKLVFRPTPWDGEMFTFVIFWYKKRDILWGLGNLVPW